MSISTKFQQAKRKTNCVSKNTKKADQLRQEPASSHCLGTSRPLPSIPEPGFSSSTRDISKIIVNWGKPCHLSLTVTFIAGGHPSGVCMPPPQRLISWRTGRRICLKCPAQIVSLRNTTTYSKLVLFWLIIGDTTDQSQIFCPACACVSLCTFYMYDYR